MEAAVSVLAAPAAAAAINAARQSLASRSYASPTSCYPEKGGGDYYGVVRGLYADEGEAKKALLTELQSIKDDTSALRCADLRTAEQAIRSFDESTGDIGMSGGSNLDRLRVASERARSAFNTVPEAADKLRAAAVLIYAEYHLAALTGVSDRKGGLSYVPNWAAGKREARRLLRQYCSPDSLPQLAAVAREELDRPLLTRLRGGERICSAQVRAERVCETQRCGPGAEALGRRRRRRRRVRSGAPSPIRAGGAGNSEGL